MNNSSQVQFTQWFLEMYKGDWANHDYLYKLPDGNGGMRYFYAADKGGGGGDGSGGRKRMFAKLADLLENDGSTTIEHAEIGEILVEAGHTGKSGYGLKHIIEQRVQKDGRNETEIAALLSLIIDAAVEGKIRPPKKDNTRIEIVKDGVMAVISKTKNGRNEQWLLTGYDLFEEQEKATDTIQTVIARYGYAPEFSGLRKQVGAVTSLLKASVVQDDGLSSKTLEKSSDLPQKPQVQFTQWFLEMYGS